VYNSSYLTAKYISKYLGYKSAYILGMNGIFE